MATNNLYATYRVLPNSDNTDNFYNVEGEIRNNVSESGSIVPGTPSCSNQVRLHVPSYDGTAHSQTATGSLELWDDLTTEGANKYSLPSLALVVKNLVSGSLHLIGEDTNVPTNHFGSSNQTNVFNSPTSLSTYYAGDSNGSLATHDFSYTGKYASVYTLHHLEVCTAFNSSTDSRKYFICPYKRPTEAIDDTSNRILGTKCFTIGAGKNPCTCANLLIHSGDDDLRSTYDGGEEGSNLYWVNIKFYTKNKYGNICMKRPVTIHIEHGPDNGLNETFTPYMATTRSVATFASSSSDDVDDDCPVKCQTVDCSNPEVSDASTNDPTFNIIFVNDCVDVSQVNTSCNGSCNVYIVLIPKPKYLN